MEGGPNRPISPSMVAPGTILAGKYRVERLLGEGGMGVVVAAHHIALDQKVAIKLLRGGAMGRPDVVERFLREARNVVRLRSHHVARVFDVGTLDNGWPYIVLEYLEGSDLDHVTRREGPMAYERAVVLILQACEAVAEAHALGIVHRDIKPHNLFLTAGFGGTDLLKVLDFGIAKTAPVEGSGALTRTDNSVGSPLYMSPEQMRTPRDIDARTDVWSLGVTLYELIAARAPFDADNFPELVLKVTEGRFTPLSDIARDVPRGLSDAIGRCLAIDRDARWQDVGELATALEPFVSPGSQRLAENVRRALGRHPSSRALPSAVGSAMGTGLGAPRKALQSDPGEGAPSTMSEGSIPTAREPVPASTGPDAGAPFAQPPSTQAASAPTVPFALLSGTGASGPKAWSESTSSEVPAPPQNRAPLLAFGLGIAVMAIAGVSIFAAMRTPKGGGAVGAGSGQASASASAPLVVAATGASAAASAVSVAPFASVVLAVPTATLGSSAPRAPAGDASGRPKRPRPGERPASSAAPPAQPVPVAKPPPPTDEIPAER